MQALVKNDLDDAILDAADRLLGRFGYRKLTMDDLAQEAGVGKRTIYLHFRNKQHVILSSMDRVAERLVEHLQEIAQRSDSAASRLREMLLQRILFRFDSVRDYHKGLAELLADLRKTYLERREAYFEAEARVFAAVLEQGKRGGELWHDDAMATAHTLLLATNALLPYSLSPRELGAREEVESKSRGVARLLVRGLMRPEGIQ